jgi:pimeloyl-ACP methyl ester carboxylesterase
VTRLTFEALPLGADPSSRHRRPATQPRVFTSAGADLDVGASLGGATSLDLAVTHPEVVGRLVLAGPGLSGYRWPAEDLNQPWRVEARAALARADRVGVARAWLHSGYLLPASEQPAPAVKLRTLLADNVGFWKGLLRRREGYDTSPAPPALGRIGGIRVPTLLIVGSRDVPDIHHIVDTLQLRLPNATTVVFDGVGHLPSMEQPVRFSATVLNFLRIRRIAFPCLSRSAISSAPSGPPCPRVPIAHRP